MNDRQRVVLVVALGFATAIGIHTWDLLISTTSNGGWFAYAPNTQPIFSPNDDSDVMRRGAMWLGGVVVWAVLSALILRSRTSESRSEMD